METGRRVDARRNRDAIVRVVTEALATASDMVAHERAARLTGLSPATVYRHFRDRRSLIDAIVDSQFEVFEQLVAERAHDPEGLRPMLRLVLERHQATYPLARLLHRLPLKDQLSYVQRIHQALGPVIRRAEDTGTLRQPFGVADLHLVLTMFDAILATDRTNGTRTAEAGMEILISGLMVDPRGSDVPPARNT